VLEPQPISVALRVLAQAYIRIAHLKVFAMQAPSKFSKLSILGWLLPPRTLPSRTIIECSADVLAIVKCGINWAWQLDYPFGREFWKLGQPLSCGVLAT
jgi:hypothetical protein